MDISHTIIAKSDQLNACDLLGGPITVLIEDVKVKQKSDQPVSIFIGDGRQPFKPCLTVRRILANLWGCDSVKWIGQHMTLYCDETVRWAGEEVGGIRVSHASGITEKREVTVRASKHTVTRAIIMPLDMSLPAYSDDEMMTNSETWKNLIASGNATAERIIDKISRKCSLTDDQKAFIKSLEGPSESRDHGFTYAEIMDMINSAESVDAVSDAEALSTGFPSEQKDEIATSANERRRQLEGAE